jgi:hypothetical protein
VLTTSLILYIGYKGFSIRLLTGLKLYITRSLVKLGFFRGYRVKAPYLLIPISIIPTLIIEENILLVKAFSNSLYFSTFDFTGQALSSNTITYLTRSVTLSSNSLVIK